MHCTNPHGGTIVPIRTAAQLYHSLRRQLKLKNELCHVLYQSLRRQATDQTLRRQACTNPYGGTIVPIITAAGLYQSVRRQVVLNLQRHPYATLTKYPGKSRKPNTDGKWPFAQSGPTPRLQGWGIPVLALYNIGRQCWPLHCYNFISLTQNLRRSQ